MGWLCGVVRWRAWSQVGIGLWGGLSAVGWAEIRWQAGLGCVAQSGIAAHLQPNPHPLSLSLCRARTALWARRWRSSPAPWLRTAAPT